MRTTLDRIRHTICFELLGLLIVTPLGAWLFDLAMADMGVIAIVSATIATCWNYLYNLAFDHAMLRWRGKVAKTLVIRVFHAVMFEASLLVLLLPFIAWHLGIGLVQAFWMDISFASFYLVYAFVFNWAYDVVFPIPALPSRDERNMQDCETSLRV